MSTTETTHAPVASEALPAAADLAAASAIELESEDAGVKTTLAELARSTRTVLVVFIRHFYCGSCQDYVRALSGSAALTPLATAADTRVLIVGCGAGSLIKGYRAETGCPYPVYSDPTGRIYDTLGMHKTLAMGKKPDYVKMGFLAAVVNGITGGLKGGLTKGGDVTRVGGEWLFRGGECVWCRRMKTTRDHMEVRDVEALLAKEDK